jgi:ketosteroid isomerase-like protein
MECRHRCRASKKDAGMKTTAALALLIAFAGASAAAETADPAEVAAAERAFAADGATMGIKRSFLKWSTPDAIVFSPGPAKAHEVYGKAPDLKPGEKDELVWWPLWAGISRSGDLGFTTGPVEVKGKRTNFHYFTVWQRQPDGGWKWVYDGGGGGDGANEPGTDAPTRYLPTATVGSPSSAAALAEVRAIEAQIAAEANTDNPAAMLKRMAPDGRVHVPGLAPARDPAAFGEAFRTRPNAIAYRTQGGGASKAGDLAWTYGEADFVKDGQPIEGQYVRVWQKRPDGWKIVYDQILGRPPAPPPATGASTSAPASTPADVAASLMAADRAFAKAAEQTDLITALTSQFDRDVVMPLPNGRFAKGPDQAAAALKGNPDNPTSRVDWTPVRAGISADGQHGFTFGFMTVHPAGKPPLPAKYLAYWVKRPEGWRVLAYKRAPRPAGQVSMAEMAPSLPARLVPVATDPALLAAHRESLMDAEKAFSDEARVIGIGPAFAKYGRADAMNMGREAGFTIGNDRIGGQSGDEGQKPVTIYWSSDDVAVASSGDLGVSWGVIRGHQPGQGYPPEGSAFFTVWRRDSPDDPWRYIAE